MLQPLLARRFWVGAFLLGLLVLLGRPARASHLLGGEMTYQYQDASGPAAAPFRYQVTVTTYYNPFGSVPTPATSVQVVLFNRTTGARISAVQAPLVSTSPIVRPRLGSGCAVQGPTQPFQLLRYVVTVALPATLDGYYAVCTQTARNNTLTNVNNPGGNSGGNVPMTLYVSIPPPLIYNRSPVFTDTAVAIVCQNDTTIVLNSAVDPDGDRLIYSFGTPYGALSGTTFPPLPNLVPYVVGQGYSGLTPFGTAPGNFASINASTGVARYGATVQGQYAVAVDVSEYRRTSSGAEILLGTTRRDLQLVVASCPANVAPALTPAVTLPRAYTIEAGQALSIPITATQRDGHALLMTASSALLDGAGGFGATFNGNPGTLVSGALAGTATASGTGSVTGTFVFNSTCADARTNPYDIAITVQDQACAGKTVVDVFRVTVVKPGGPTAITGDAVVCGVPTTHSYTASGGTATSISWRVVGGTIVGSATANPVQVTWTAATGGTLVARGLSQYGCLTDSVSQSISVAPVPALTVTGNLTICQGSSTTISVSGAGAVYTVTGGPVTGSGATFTLAPTQTTTYTVTSAQLAPGGCPSTAQVTVTVNPLPATGPIAGAASVCPTVGGIAYSVPSDQGLTYQWAVTGGTIQSGQGTAAITVNWGAAGTGSVSVIVTNGQGCASPATTLPVIINQVLQTVKPSGPTSVCQADGPYAYSTPAVNGSSFAWQLVGSAQGTLTSTGNTTSISFTTPGVGKLVVTQTSNPAGGICRGVSDTLYITVKPSPSTALAIQGPDRFCVNSGAQTYTLPGADGSTYAWQLNGAALASTGSSVSIPASTAVGTYTLTARETNAGNCAGPLYTKTFVVDPRPGLLVLNGPRFVCPATRTLTYTVPNPTATSTYQWAVTGGTIQSGQGTATITVNFPATLATSATVSVTETSQYGCAGAAVAATVVPDNAQAPQLTLASVVATDNTKVALTFSVASAAATPNPVQVLRREAGSTGAYTTVGTVAATATTFVDATANAAQTAYQYSLALTNGCGDVLPGTTTQTTVLLRAVAVPGTPGTPRDQGGSNLSWTAYDGFAVANYLVYKQNDNGGYQLLATLPATTFTYTTPNGGQGFNQCFRVVAVSSTGATNAALQSNSNTACVEFTNGLAFYNIITPNNDGLNDKLEILNVQLYPGNTMQIFNRWGRQVYTTSNYNNDTNYWGTDPSVAPGVYYFLFKLPNGSTTKGWVEVVK